MNLIQKSISKLDQLQRQHPALGFLFAVFKKYGDDEAGQRAALLTYFAFLSLFPLLLVLTTVLHIVFANNVEMQQRIIDAVTTYIPLIGDQLEVNIQASTATGIVLLVGILLTFYGARGIAESFRNAVNHIWQTPRVRRPGFPKGLLKSFSIIIVGGLGLILTPIIAGYAISFNHGWLTQAIALVITATMLFGLFILLGRTAQASARPIKDIWVGAAVSAVVLTILQVLGTYLLTHQLRHLDNLYGTFALVLGLLYWLYIQMQVVVLAIELDTVRVYRLWPRALDINKLTDQDRAAYRLYAERNAFHEEEQIGVTTKKRPN